MPVWSKFSANFFLPCLAFLGRNPGEQHWNICGIIGLFIDTAERQPFRQRFGRCRWGNDELGCRFVKAVSAATELRERFGSVLELFDLSFSFMRIFLCFSAVIISPSRNFEVPRWHGPRTAFMQHTEPTMKSTSSLA